VEPTQSGWWIPSLALHPTLPVVATAGSEPGTPEDDRCKLVHFWEFTPDVLLRRSLAPTVAYTSAKIVLVGESNVGKSYLAHRIATGSPPEEGTIKSTHGMKFWRLEPELLSPSAKTPEGQRRDVVLWDMGGQDEYRLIHQLFLHDTTVALVLLDPTRGAAAFKEVETWNKYLDKQLRGRASVKFLVGAKMDQPSNTIDLQALVRLCEDCGFRNYFETSAITGRGLTDLCVALAEAIDWDKLGLTSRPEVFQQIRDELETRRKRGEVVIRLVDLGRETVAGKKADVPRAAVQAVTEQLATQGLIARSRVSTGEPVLVLQVQEIERYAGSLILAARNNPRGVAALELRAIAHAEFPLPGIDENDRLPRNHEKPVLECTVQLMLEHGICFQHEGLLVFPSLFAPAARATDTKLPHAVSLYYDFAGAIDNVYASLVAWLVLAQDFGRVRLWSDRAEFEVKDGGLCGLRKVGRSGGFAHVDVYFDAETPAARRKEFISFVEDHLARNGVEVREHVAIKCSCGHEFAEETLRQRIARGDRDVLCPVCETRHSLTEGATEAREKDPKVSHHTWALRTQIEKLREQMTRQAVQVLVETEDASPASGPIHLLHLSDLHFSHTTPVKARLQWLEDDLQTGLGIGALDYLVVSGDFTNRGSAEGLEKAYEFVSELAEKFSLSAERCVFVPGNHDVRDLREAYEWRENPNGLKEVEWVKQGEIILARSKNYPQRFSAFSEEFYHKFLQKPYPLEWPLQAFTIPFWETGIQFLALNSCWQVDQFNRKRSGIHPEAVASALNAAKKQERDARYSGNLKGPVLRIAVWHHAVSGPEMMQDVDFLGHLHNAGVRIALHGDVHESRRGQDEPWRHGKPLFIMGAGAFGAPAANRPESTPRLFNLLAIDRTLRSARIHTRQQLKPDSPWKPWNEWPRSDGQEGAVPYYDIKW
jgi:small GTP-binding protein